MRFVHETRPQRVRFGSGTAPDAVAEEVERLGAHRVMVIASPAARDAADRITAGLPLALRHHEVVMHVPTEVAARAHQAAVEARADAVVSIGGGSATGLAKAVALASGLPVVAVPTTYAGSEATAVWGTTDGSRKTTGSDPRVLPRAVVYDAELTLSLPVGMSVASGLNAVAHCVDSMWSPGSDPIDRTLAAEGIRALAEGLPLVTAGPADLRGRELALYGAYVSAVAFSSAGSGLHHRICHVLGGAYRLPHAQTHAIVLPHVLALNAPYAPEAQARMARAFDAGSALAGLDRLRRAVDAPRALGDVGLRRADVSAAAGLILPVVPPDNPAPVTRAVLERLLTAAWNGDDPA
ncbi:maleylacetate reductase [Streptomyces sulfonofaciens]|uniref:Maleylacetate reductase n=1 Tax=Streptomyces sulfonofaciens TaxID=68272 RepID=A0A919KTB8_9ACTN|nr:maleylacetate reductase [Streptomyces sulfonofaciens]GHH71814.1 maleylacetate reductase [Streptomyces sulfonofaciens]